MGQAELKSLGVAVCRGLAYEDRGSQAPAKEQMPELREKALKG